MKEIIENIKNFFGEIAQFIRNLIGPDLTEAELVEGEYGDDYSYRRINGYNELGPERQRILDEATDAVIEDDKSMSMGAALKAVRSSKFVPDNNGRNVEKQGSTRAQNKDVTRETRTGKIDKDRES